MHVILAALQQFNFCCLLRSIIASSVQETFSLSITVHAQKYWNSRLLTKKVCKTVDAGILKKLRRFQYWNQNNFLTKNCVLDEQNEQLTRLIYVNIFFIDEGNHSKVDTLLF